MVLIRFIHAQSLNKLKLPNEIKKHENQQSHEAQHVRVLVQN